MKVTFDTEVTVTMPNDIVVDEVVFWNWVGIPEDKELEPELKDRLIRAMMPEFLRSGRANLFMGEILPESMTWIIKGQG